jgi:hypothetical protein
MKVWTPNGEWSAETNYGSLDHTMTVLKEHLENCPDWNNVRITMSRVSTVKATPPEDLCECGHPRSSHFINYASGPCCLDCGSRNEHGFSSARRRVMSERNLPVGWQACPVCQGTGVFTMFRDSSSVLPTGTCPVCMGSRIISTVTGLPPAAPNALWPVADAARKEAGDE